MVPRFWFFENLGKRKNPLRGFFFLALTYAIASILFKQVLVD
jgi:hypothetical protein